MSWYGENDILWLCPKCGGNYNLSENETPPNDGTCSLCGGKFIKTKYRYSEYSKNREIIRQEYIYSRPDYDPEEMAYWQEVNRQRMRESAKKLGPIKKPEPEPDNTPKCPICQSTNLSKISTAKKAGKIALFGIFGMGDNGKTWKCNNCGSKF